MERLTPFESALAAVLAGAGPRGVEGVALADAVGRVLATPVRAARAMPAADIATMDGYALSPGDGPWRVIGVGAAGGAAAPSLAAGEAARVFTGARVPDGADAVLPQERAVAADGLVRLAGARPAAGASIRRAGADFRAGDAGGVAGAPVTPQFVGLAAAMGCARVDVFTRARVGVLATGDELVAAGETPGPGGTVDSAGPMVEAMLAKVADVERLGIVRDGLAAVTAAFAAARAFDLIVTIGGASVGEHDLVRPALEAAGGVVALHRVAMRPGKPLLAGRLDGARVLGLPGNPASAFVCGALFALPLARALGGWTRPVAPLLSARAGAALGANDARRDHLRARLETRGGALWAVPFGVQDSGLTAVLGAADALIVRAAGAAAVAEGDPIAVLDIRFGQL